MTPERHTISVLVENEFGVLARVASMFAARGYNIDSLSVAPTLNPRLSRITLTTSGSPLIIEQISKQLNRLIDVVETHDLTGENFINLETILVKFKNDPTLENQLANLQQTWKDLKIDRGPETLILQFTSAQSEVEQLIGQLQSLSPLELMRSGVIAMARHL